MNSIRAWKQWRREPGAGSRRLRLRPAFIALEGRALLTTFMVTSTADDGSANTLRWAINQANASNGNDTIDFSSKFNAPQTITLTGGPLALTDPATTTITGPSASLLTVSGGGTSRVFDIQGGAAALSGLTISGGKAGFGGGIYNTGGSLSLANVTVTSNSAQFGGGVANVNSGMTALTDCTISGNSAAVTGGGVVSNSGTLTLVGTTVSGNTATNGGGLANLTSGTATVTGGTFRGNTASDQGGGLFNNGPALSLTDATIAGNSAAGQSFSSGGGLFDTIGAINLTGCTVTGNSAPNGGGGLYNYAGTATLINDTLVRNSAYNGGGLCVIAGTSTLTNDTITGNSAERGGGMVVFSTATLTNTIVTANSGDLGGDIALGIGGGYTGTNNLISAAAFLAPLGDYGGPTQTAPLLPGSPAIGAGKSGAGIPLTDQRGQPRTGHVDIGAFQSQGFSIAPVVGSTPQSTMAGAAFANPLTVVVTPSNPVEPVDGGSVSFAVTAASGGASATLSAATAVIAGGKAGVTAAANVKLGQYTASAWAAGADQAGFDLNNTQAFSLVVNSTQDLPLLTDGQNSLRAAIAYAANLAGPQTITFDSTVFGATPHAISLTGGQLTLAKPASMTIEGPGAALLTVKGGGASRVFDIEGGSAAISGLTVAGGNSGTGKGGGLFNNGGTLSLSGCTISGNTASGKGGGVYSSGGTLSLSGCTILGNASAAKGGGLYNSGGTLSLSGCAISGNTASGSGGDVYNNGGTLTLTGCTISDGGPSANSHLYFGGGLFNNGGSASLSGCTISDNTASATGGGLYNKSGLLSLSDCTISGNASVAGAGLYNNRGTLTLAGCTISDNALNFNTPDGIVSGAYSGGGLQSLVGTLTMTGCSISGNSAAKGAGLFITAVRTTLSDCAISGNSAAASRGFPTNPNGGGMYSVGSPVSLAGCIISGNSASAGGGLCLTGDSKGTLTNVTVSGNSALAAGGGLYFTGGSTGTFTNVTVTGNSAATKGGALYLNGGSTAALTNATVAANSASNGGGLYLTGSSPNFGASSASLTNTIVAGQTSGGDTAGAGSISGTNNVIGVNPELAPLGDYGGPTFTMALLPDSPAKGGGTSVGVPATDQRGFARGPSVDIGAFQSQSSALTVNATADGVGSNPGQLTLRQSVNLANVLASAVSIGFDPTVFAGPHTITLTAGPLTLTDHATTTINGPGASLLTVDAGGGNRAFDVQGGSAALSGLTLTGGNAADGGGVRNDGGTLALTDTTVSDNTATNGGGVATESGGVTSMTGCTVTGNSARDGGGVATLSGGATNLTGCTVSGNYVSGLRNDGGNGGGAYVSDGTSTLTNCTITGNHFTHAGGGVSSVHSNITLTDCWVSGNGIFTGRLGGGLYNGGEQYSLGSPMTLINCTISGNSAGFGGGVYTLFAPTILLNCTVTGNSSPYGSGLSILGVSLSLTNTIVAGNFNSGDISGPTTGSNSLIGGNPLLGPVGDYCGPTSTFPLLPGSPAIGRGTTAGAPLTDQRGQPRSGHNDIGAFQSQGFTLTPVAGSTPQSAVVGKPLANPLAVVVSAVNAVEPVDGGVISFAAPPSDSGASATLSAATATIQAGQAAVTATANGAPGGYSVTATAAGASSASFSLTNTQTLESPGPILIRPQSPTFNPPATARVLQNVDNLTSLRAAVAYANSHPGPDTITLGPPVFGRRPQTIRVIGGPLVLTDSATTTIIGPGARLLTLKGDGKRRIFDVRGGSLALSGVAITGGRAERGGGIRNDDGTLGLTDVIIRKNSARRSGGGLFNSGTATLSDVVVRGNHADVGGNVANFGTLSLTRVTMGSNSARPGTSFASGLAMILARRLPPQERSRIKSITGHQMDKIPELRSAPKKRLPGAS